MQRRSANTEMSSPSYSSAAGNLTISSVYVSQKSVELTVVRNISSATDDFIVKDVYGRVFFRVMNCPVSTVHDLCVLLDHEGNPLITLRKKILTMHNRWQVFKGEGKDSKDLLYSVKETSILKCKTQLDIFLATQTGNKTCDFKVRGNWSDRSCMVYAGDTSCTIAEMGRKDNRGMSTEKEELKINVYPNTDCLFVASLILILDKIDRRSTDQQYAAEPVGIL